MSHAKNLRKKPKENLFVEKSGRFIPSYPPAVISGYIEKLDRPAWSEEQKERLVVTGPEEFKKFGPYASPYRFQRVSYRAGPARMLANDGNAKKTLNRIIRLYKI